MTSLTGGHYRVNLACMPCPSQIEDTSCLAHCMLVYLPDLLYSLLGLQVIGARSHDSPAPGVTQVGQLSRSPAEVCCVPRCVTICQSMQHAWPGIIFTLERFLADECRSQFCCGTS